LGIQHSKDVLPEHIDLWKQLASAKRDFSTQKPLDASSINKKAA
jgi:hypothetical protein